MELKQWRQLFPDKILRRGQDYYEAGAVGALRRQGNVIRAEVRGGARYQVELTLTGELIEEWACTCPYGQDGTPCKHLAAMFLALERPPVPRQPGVEELVAGLEDGRARRLLARLARRDQRVARWLYRELAREGAVSPPAPPAGDAGAD